MPINNPKEEDELDLQPCPHCGTPIPVVKFCPRCGYDGRTEDTKKDDELDSLCDDINTGKFGIISSDEARDILIEHETGDELEKECPYP